MASVFKLVKGGFEIVQSAIYTLKLDVQGKDRPVEIDKANLIDTTNPVKANGTNNYRFKSVVPVPVMDAVVTTQSLQDQIGQLAAAIDMYDAADQIETTDGRLIARREYIVPRNADGTAAMSTAAYLALIIRNGIRLDMQKSMQAPLRDVAEQTIRSEQGLVAPATKPRRMKAVDGKPYDPEQELQ